jgi:hypothetical protein
MDTFDLTPGDTVAMKRILLFVSCLLAARGFAGDNPAVRVPVLVELFTSEGCSSCPPADRLLQKLDHDQPVPEARIIVLSEHVDYWDQDGWKDPFSSAQYTQRQRDYSTALKAEVYTPQMIVGGTRPLVGNEEREALRAIREAAKQTTAPLRIETQKDGRKTRIEVFREGASQGSRYLVLAHDAKESQVLRGENAGHNLSHVAVVYSLRKLGNDHRVTAKLEPASRIVAFEEKQGVGITALGEIRVP